MKPSELLLSQAPAGLEQSMSHRGKVTRRSQDQHMQIDNCLQAQAMWSCQCTGWNPQFLGENHADYEQALPSFT